MNKNNKRIIGILIFCLFGLNILISNPIKASEDTQFLLTKFDNVATGLDDFTDGYFICNNTGTANNFESFNNYYNTAPNSLKVTGGGFGTCTFTSDFEYIGFINFSLKTLNDGSIKFYDYNDNNVISLSWSTAGAWQVNHVGGSTAFGTAGDDITKQLYLQITHLGTNQFNYSVYNSTYDLIIGVNESGNYAGSYTNFSYINLSAGATGTQGWDNLYCSTDTSGVYCDVSDYYSLCTNELTGYGMVGGNSRFIEHMYEYEITGIIHSVILPISIEQYNIANNRLDYQMVINGFQCGNADYIINFGNYYGVQWCDLNDGDGVEIDNIKPLFAFYCDRYQTYGSTKYYWYGVGVNLGGIGISRKHDDINLYYNNQLDGSLCEAGKISLCFYYETDLSDELIIDDSILNPYITKFGNEFIQFYRYDIDCEYQIGDMFKIIYNLSDDNITDSDYNNPYIYIIQKVDIENSSYRWWTQGFITMYQSYQSDIKTIQKDIKEKGNYRILLYNSSDYGATTDTLLYTSMTIYVCDNTTPIVPPGTTEEVSFNILLGLALSLGIGIGFLLLTKETIVFPIVSGAVAFVISRPEMGSYWLFPEVVGIGLIAILVLISFILWISN